MEKEVWVSWGKGSGGTVLRLGGKEAVAGLAEVLVRLRS